MAFPVQNIKDACKEKGTTIAEIERKLHIGNGIIARWETNKAYPPLDRLQAIADELHVPLSRLTGVSQPSDTLDDLQRLTPAMRELLDYAKDKSEKDIIKIIKMAKAALDE